MLESKLLHTHTHMYMPLYIIMMFRMKPSKPNKDEDPGVGLMKLMQKMYDEGDDDMKRTIKKAWHESQEKRMKGEDL